MTGVQTCALPISISLNAMKYWTNVPIGLITPIAMILIMMGEGAQRLEDKKTIQALYTDNDPNKKDDDIVQTNRKLLDKKRLPASPP